MRRGLQLRSRFAKAELTWSRAALGAMLAAALACAPAASEALLEPTPGAGVVLDGDTSCAAFTPTLGIENHRARLRLGFSLSRVVLRGRLEAPAEPDGTYGALTVQRMGRGPEDWSGRRFRVPWRARWSDELSPTADVWVGLRYGGVSDADRLGSPLAVVVADGSDDLADRLGPLPTPASEAVDPRAAWIDGPGLAQWAARYRYAWTYRAAPRVVIAEVIGLIGWDGGALRTAALYEVQAALSGPAAPARVETEYGSEPWPVCGGRRILALGLDGEASDLFTGCSSSWGYSSPAPTYVRAERADHPEARREVERWVTAAPPRLRAASLRADRRPELARVEGFAPWSRPLSVVEALAAASGVAQVEILAVEPDGDGHRVTLGTDLGPLRSGDIAEYRVQLAFRCADPRWLEVGARYAAPFVVDLAAHESIREAVDAGALFFTPGVLLPPDREASDLHQTLRELLPRD